MGPEIVADETRCALLVGCGMIVFLMQAGFCMLEAGAVRSKNSVHVAVKNLFDTCVVSIAFVLIGFGVAFGDSVWGLFGASDFGAAGCDSAIDASFLFYQTMFCGTAATIVSGAVTERIRTKAYLFVTLVLAIAVYPPVVHWVWTMREGEPVGWLARMGFIDFAGATVVHGVGAWSALAIVLRLGPRRGRFPVDASGGAPTIGNNLTLATLGVFLLWFGWFGFNVGSAYADPAVIPRVAINTFVAPATAGALLLGWKCSRGGMIELKPIVAGVIGGLTAVTAGCHLLDVRGAMVMGAAGGVAAVVASEYLRRLKIDDPLDVIACHGVAGVVGAIGLAVLAPAGSFPLGPLPQAAVQLAGCLAVFVFTFAAMTCATCAWLWLWPLRVPPIAEEIGLNVYEHGARSEFQELLIKARYGSPDVVVDDVATDDVADEFSEYGVLRQAVDEMLEASRSRHARLQGVIEETRAGAVEILLDLCEYRDNETAAHLRRIQLYSVLLAEDLQHSHGEVDEEFIDDLRRASVLHDIGKVSIPDEVLLKPGRFTPDERAVMATHTTVGAEILHKAQRRLGDDVSFVEMATEVARSHHERYDGTGYPEGLAGEDIPLAARIVAVADVFDALISCRVYKKPIAPLETRAIILSEAGSHFDPEIVASFVVQFDELVAVHRRYTDVDEDRIDEPAREAQALGV